jgi:hypothetical protein
LSEIKTAKEIRDRLSVSFPKGVSKANYDYESYMGMQITESEAEVLRLREGIQKFLDKNFIGGSKSDREDYTQMVSCKDIWELRELIK